MPGVFAPIDVEHAPTSIEHGSSSAPACWRILETIDSLWQWSVIEHDTESSIISARVGLLGPCVDSTCSPRPASTPRRAASPPTMPDTPTHPTPAPQPQPHPNRGVLARAHRFLIYLGALYVALVVLVTFPPVQRQCVRPEASCAPCRRSLTDALVGSCTCTPSSSPFSPTLPCRRSTGSRVRARFSSLCFFASLE